MNEPTPPTPGILTRRHFLKSSSAVVAGAALANLSLERMAHAAGSDELKIALIGCGGRGSGAADHALNTHTLGPVKLVAMADAFENRLTGALNGLKNKHGDRVDVPEDRRFVGFEGYKQAIALADVVILATPPGFRPMQFEEAIRQGKHVFAEKPVATDAPGVRKFLAAAEESKKKGLKVGIGLQRHHQKGYLETIKRIHDGAIGDVTALRVYWNGNTPWVRERAVLEKQYNRKLTEMEYQMHNWYYFVWLCGDHIVEQHIHNHDIGNWVKGKYPVRANGMGGVQVRKGRDYGEIFDHHAVEYIYDDDSRMYSQCRHIVGCWNSVSEHAHGTKGQANISGHQIMAGGDRWRHRGQGDMDAFQQEHFDLFDAIRNNKAFNEAHNGAMSTMTSILGRMCTYSGKEITMEDALKSEKSYFPDKLAWDALPKSLPGPDGMYEVALPGLYNAMA
jgi:myo-inositol 2-dehydrogenase / D-chiro-inositol 1-dehydrogenase